MNPHQRVFLAAFRETGNVRLASIDLNRLTDEQLVRISAGEHPFSVLANALGRGLSRDALLGLPAASEGAGGAEDGDAPDRQKER